MDDWCHEWTSSALWSSDERWIARSIDWLIDELIAWWLVWVFDWLIDSILEWLSFLFDASLPRTFVRRSVMVICCLPVFFTKFAFVAWKRQTLRPVFDMASDEDDEEFKPARCPPLPRSCTALHPLSIHIKVLTQRRGKEYRGEKQGWLILNTRPSLFVEIHHEFTGHFNSVRLREMILGHQPPSNPLFPGTGGAQQSVGDPVGRVRYTNICCPTNTKSGGLKPRPVAVIIQIRYSYTLLGCPQLHLLTRVLVYFLTLEMNVQFARSFFSLAPSTVTTQEG